MANISKYINDFIESLKTVATTGSYNDLINKPTLGTAAALNVGTNANEILQLNSQGKIPSVDGSLLINILASEVSPVVPYSVISAKTSSGVASFITKTSNTQIVFDTNSGGIPIKICYPDGSVESNSSLTGISGISTDGTYYVIKEKNLNPYITTLIPIESYVAPTTPATNQLWLDLSVIPYVPKKWNGSSWVLIQFVKLGEFVRTGGVIGTPVSYALNGRYTIQTAFNFPVNYIHNLGVSSLNQQIMCYDALCITSTSGFTAGYAYPVFAAKDNGFTASVFTQKHRNYTRLSYQILLTALDDTSSVVALASGNTNFNLMFSVKRSF
jgi:hypothetical protein